MAVNKERIALWVEALRSGEYVQGREYLKTPPRLQGGENKPRYCCLGVATEVALANGCPVKDGENFDDLNGTLWRSISTWYGFTDADSTELSWVDDPVIAEEPYFNACHGGGEFHQIRAAVANDERRWTFARIADEVEKLHLRGDSDDAAAE